MLVNKKAGMLAAAAAAATVGVGGAARADQGVVEVDGFGGWHVVSDRSDLGKPENADQVPSDAGLFGLRVGYFLLDRLSLEGEFAIMPTDATGDTSDDATMFGYRAQLVYQLGDLHELGGTLALVGGFGGLTTTASDKTGSAGYTGAIDAGSVFMPHVGLAAKVEITDSFGLRFDGRLFFVPASELDDGSSLAADWEATVGFYKYFGGEKAPAPEPEPEPVALAPSDSDRDGLTDDRDPCPDKAEDKDGFEDEDGCPEDDNDADGVADAADKCPDKAEDKDAFQDEDGCPEDDNDADGVADATDKCANEAEDKDGFEDEDGCPDPDNDQDGVLDADDRCPDQLETKNGYQDKDGCADDVPKAVAKYTGIIKGINFATGKAIIKRPSFSVLDAAVKVLMDYPELKLEISGHTDDVGDADTNRKLSQDRAQAVKDYMVTKGVTEDRLRAVGYGPDKPADPAKTRKARALNRRVEFTLVSD